jgi:hypothetical protein
VNDFAKADFASLDEARAEAMLVAKELMKRAASDAIFVKAGRIDAV